MGRYQPFRGDPTVKQYFVTDNFSGGINTLAVDDAMSDREFRELVNVELATEGLLQNRKGFGEIKILSSYLETFGVTMPTETYSLVKVFKNERRMLQAFLEGGALFKWVEVATSAYINEKFPWFDEEVDYQAGDGVFYNDVYYTCIYPNVIEVDGERSVQTPDNEDYWQVYENVVTDTDLPSPNTYDLAGVVYDNVLEETRFYRSVMVVDGGILKMLIVSGTGLYVLTVDNTLGASIEELDVDSTKLPTVTTYRSKVNSIKTVDFVDKIYFSLNDISPELRGIVVFNTEDDTFVVWRGAQFVGGMWVEFLGSAYSDLAEEPYKPTPYEITSTGYNALHEFPLQAIDSQETGIKQLRDIIILDEHGNWLDKIPTSGTFIVRVYFTGLNFSPEILNINFYKTEESIPVYNVDDEIIDYTISHGNPVPFDLLLVDAQPAYFDFYIANLDRTTSRGYLYVSITKKDNVTNTKNVINSTYLYPFKGIAVGDFVHLSGSAMYAYRKKVGTFGYSATDFETFPLVAKKVVGDVTVDIPSFPTFEKAMYDGKYFELSDATPLAVVYQYDHDTSSYTLVSASPSPFIGDSLNEFIPFKGDIIDDLSIAFKYYARTASNGSSLDFEEISFDPNEVIPGVVVRFDVSASTESKPIKGFELENVRMLEIGNKLVLYKGNTLWFSHLFRFDYFPNFAYLVLPINATDEITNISYYRGVWIIFTKNTIWRMKGTYGDPDWQVSIINDTMGCVSPLAVRALENTLYFVSNNGLYRLTQNYYQDGIENVSKADRNIPKLIKPAVNIESIIYQDQLILYTPSGDKNAIRMYYNYDLADKQHPFVTDVYGSALGILFGDYASLLSLKNGKFYVFDQGYTDFGSPYSVTIRTPRLTFGYPTHDKKIKNVFVKTTSSEDVVLYLTGWVDGFETFSPNEERVSVEEDGEIVYTFGYQDQKDTNIILDDSTLGDFELSDDYLGDSSIRLHKIVVANKGRSFSLKIECLSAAPFGILSIGYVTKLGKIKERG